MAADTLCSRVPKFIFLNKGKLAEASLVRTIASEDPSSANSIRPHSDSRKQGRANPSPSLPKHRWPNKLLPWIEER